MLYLITWLTDFAAFLFIFAVGRQLAEQGADALLLGSLGAALSAANALSNALSGRFSDRVGRRRVAVAGVLFLFACLSLLLWSAPGQGTYYTAYIASGFAFGAIYPPIIAWLSQGRRGRSASRAYLFFCLAWNCGVLSGQLVGGWLFQEGGATWPLRAALALLVAEGLCLLLVPAAAPNASAEEHQARTATELSAAFARLAWVANVGGAFSISIVIFLFPKLLVRLGVPAEGHGSLLAVGRLFAIATYCLLHASTFWHHRFTVALAAQALGVLGMLVLATAETTSGLTAGLASLSVLLGYNYFASLYYSTTGSADHRKGAASGVHEATLAVGFAGGSLFGGLAGRYAGDRAPYLLAAGVMTVLVLPQMALHGRLVRRQQKEDPGLN
jgi:MFS family permease